MISPEWVAVGLTVAVQLIGYGRLKERVNGIAGRVTKVETQIDKWRDAGVGVTVQKSAHSHGGN